MARGGSSPQQPASPRSFVANPAVETLLKGAGADYRRLDTIKRELESKVARAFAIDVEDRFRKHPELQEFRIHLSQESEYDDQGGYYNSTSMVLADNPQVSQGDAEAVYSDLESWLEDDWYEWHAEVFRALSDRDATLICSRSGIQVQDY